MHHHSILERLARQAVQLGADTLVIEYKDGYEEIVASQASFGYGIGRFPSSGRVAARLRQQLRLVSRRPRRIVIDGDAYEVRGEIYESFGEEAFRVELWRVRGGCAGAARRR